jgi:nitronate monooxygenase
MVLVPQVVDAVGVPVIAAGGIADGRGIAAALALGAEGVQIGTALLRSDEGAYDAHQRRRLAEARGEDTVVTRGVSGRPARGLRSALTDSGEIAEDALEYPLQFSLTGPLSAAPDVKPTWSGQGVRLSRAQRAAAIVDRIVGEAFRAIGTMSGPVAGPGDGADM